MTARVLLLSLLLAASTAAHAQDLDIELPETGTTGKERPADGEVLGGEAEDEAEEAEPSLADVPPAEEEESDDVYERAAERILAPGSEGKQAGAPTHRGEAIETLPEVPELKRGAAAEVEGGATPPAPAAGGESAGAPDAAGTRGREEGASPAAPGEAAGEEGAGALARGSADAAAAEEAGEATGTPAMASEVRLPEASVNDLYAAWARRRERLLEMDRAGVAAAEAEIERLRRVLGIREVPDLSWALLREAAETAELDREAALARAALAVRLSPDLPGPRFALARLRLAQAPGEVGAWAGEVWAGLKQVFSVDPVRRTAAGNLVLILLTGLLAAGVVFVLVTMGRVLRTFLHDLHHLLPRGSTRLQAGVLGVALLVAPFVLGLGLAFGVVVLAAAAWLYVGLRDRVVLALTLGIFAATPVVLDQVAAVAGFWNAPAGDLWLLENTARQEGPARRLEAWAKAHEGQVPWQIFHALGNWHLRSGRLDEAEAMFQRALSVEGRAAPSLVGLGIVRFARGDLPGAKESFKAAIAADPKHAPAYHNLAKVYFRMGELEPGQEARRRARELDRALVTAHPDEASELNVGLAGCPLPTPFPPALVVPEGAKDASALVDVRLSSIGPPDAAPLVPAGGLALLLLVGFVFGRLRPSKTCVKCGRSVCHRCDPDVGHGHLCGQCVNVFQKRGAVPPQVKVEKELRIRRYQALKDRIAAALSLVLPGAGQVASGRPVAGFLLLTVFLAAAAAFAAYFGPISDPLTVGARLPLARAVIGGGAGLVAYVLAQWGIFRRNP